MTSQMHTGMDVHINVCECAHTHSCGGLVWVSFSYEHAADIRLPSPLSAQETASAKTNTLSVCMYVCVWEKESKLNRDRMCTSKMYICYCACSLILFCIYICSDAHEHGFGFTLSKDGTLSNPSDDSCSWEIVSFSCHNSLFCPSSLFLPLLSFLSAGCSIYPQGELYGWLTLTVMFHEDCWGGKGTASHSMAPLNTATDALLVKITLNKQH